MNLYLNMLYLNDSFLVCSSLSVMVKNNFLRTFVSKHVCSSLLDLPSGLFHFYYILSHATSVAFYWLALADPFFGFILVEGKMSSGWELLSTSEWQAQVKKFQNMQHWRKFRWKAATWWWLCWCSELIWRSDKSFSQDNWPISTDFTEGQTWCECKYHTSWHLQQTNKGLRLNNIYCFVILVTFTTHIIGGNQM